MRPGHDGFDVVFMHAGADDRLGTAVLRMLGAPGSGFFDQLHIEADRIGPPERGNLGKALVHKARVGRVMDQV